MVIFIFFNHSFNIFNRPNVEVTYDESSAILRGANGQMYKMLAVDGGQFTMGSQLGAPGAGANESPQHGVALSSFRMGATEVPQWLWAAVMGASDVSDNSQLPHAYFEGDNLPMESVSVADIKIFLERLNRATGQQFRLPTEAEWEYAARGGKMAVGDTRYAGSDSLTMVGWVDDNSQRRPSKVASLAPNRLGLYDMTGNVAEWTADHYGIYHQGFVTDPTGPSSGGSRKQVVRGGSSESTRSEARLKGRSYEDSDKRLNTIGFRLAL